MTWHVSTTTLNDVDGGFTVVDSTTLGNHEDDSVPKGIVSARIRNIQNFSNPAPLLPTWDVEDRENNLLG
jgi:hypothetical protein